MGGLEDILETNSKEYYDGLLIEVTWPEDVFRAKNIIEYEVPDRFVEVDTFFVDSFTGEGSAIHGCLGKEELTDKVAELLTKHPKLYAGLTGIGQFQVYVTLYKLEDE